MLRFLIKLTFIFGFFLFSCKKDIPSNPIKLNPEDNEQYSGGNATVFDETPNAFGHQIDGLDNSLSNNFFLGNSFFNFNWVTAPSSTSARDGLGPYFNAQSCSGCHFKDGRGRPPKYNGEVGTGFLIRISTLNNYGQYVSNNKYGDQIQDQSIIDFQPEANIEILYEEINGMFGDGENYIIQKPNYILKNLQFGDLNNTLYSPRIAQQMVGLGLLEAISESDILLKVDEFDSDNDGISGKANYVKDLKSNNTKLGRFGWKANQPSLFQQTAAAFLGDIGITSSLFPNENCFDSNCINSINGGNPEISDSDLQSVVNYSSTLAVPARRNYTEEDVILGKLLFFEIGCEKCHKQTFTTSNFHLITALNNQKIYPYSDLLLHDMGAGLADNRPDGLANGSEWRTQPLWGIGLIKTVNKHTNLLHDGRARNIEEAIIWHGGEAENSKLKYLNLTKANRLKLIKFIESL